MTEDLAALCRRRVETRIRFNELGLVNTYGRSADDLARMDIAYARARIECLRAEDAYQRAIAEAVAYQPTPGDNQDMALAVDAAGEEG